MLYPEPFKPLETVRRTMATAIPRASLEAPGLTDEQRPNRAMAATVAAVAHGAQAQTS